MFGYFPLSVGIANLVAFAGALTVWPTYLTRGKRGAEVASSVLVQQSKKRPEGPF